MGQGKLGNIMKSLAKHLQTDVKITNHSTRKTVVAKLKATGQPRHKIIQITGHSNESSLDDYDEIQDEERQQLSHIISGYRASTPTSSSSTSTSVQASTSSAVSLRGPSRLPCASSQSHPGNVLQPIQNLPFGRQQQGQQIFNNCSFNINYGVNSNTVESAPKRRRRVIESDSDSE